MCNAYYIIITVELRQAFFEDFFILSFTTLEGFAICISFFFIVVICEVGVVAVVLSSFLSSFLFSIVTSFDFASNKKFLIELM